MPRWAMTVFGARSRQPEKCIQFMKLKQGLGMSKSLVQRTARLVLLAIIAGVTTIQRADAATSVVIWDTGSPLPDPGDAENRSGWKAVPSELLALEADPSKAASDPGYYGREYSFSGDAVVE